MWTWGHAAEFAFAVFFLCWSVWLHESIEKMQARMQALEDGQKARDAIIQKWLDDPWDLILIRHGDRLDMMEAALKKLRDELDR